MNTILLTCIIGENYTKKEIVMRVKDQLDATEFGFIVEEVIALHVSGAYAHRQEQQELHRQHMVFQGRGHTILTLRELT
jgi:hypothetical protein